MYFESDSLFSEQQVSISRLAKEFITNNQYQVQFVPNFSSDKSKGFNLNTENLQYLSYRVDLNKELQFLPTFPIIDSKGMKVINWNNILVQFKGFEEVPLEITYFSLGQAEVLAPKSFEYWQLNPTILGIKSEFTISNTNQSKVFVNSRSLSVQPLFELFGKAEYTLVKFENTEQTSRNYIVLIDSTSSVSGAIARAKNVVFYFDQALMTEGDLYTIQKTIIHELFHVYVPEPFGRQEPADLWKEEALAEYLTLKYMLKSGLLSEVSFLRKMEQKIRLSKKYLNTSLQALSFAATTNQQLYDGFYSKGVLLMWYLDAEIVKATQDEYQIEDVLITSSGHNIKVPNSSLNESIDSIIDVHSQENIPIDLNNFLPTWGIRHESRKQEFYFETQSIELANNQKSIKVIQADNYTGLKIGDQIVRVNSYKSKEEIVDFLAYPTCELINFVIIRDGTKYKWQIASPMQKSRVRIESLARANSLSKEQILHWQRYIN